MTEEQPYGAWCTIWLIFTGYTVVSIRFTANGEKVEQHSVQLCKSLGETWPIARERAEQWLTENYPAFNRLPHTDGGIS
jgi:hypothetical protein